MAELIYPDKNQVRSISIREAARIQSFPDDFFFEGGQTASFKQIGNFLVKFIIIFEPSRCI